MSLDDDRIEQALARVLENRGAGRSVSVEAIVAEHPMAVAGRIAAVGEVGAPLGNFERTDLEGRLADRLEDRPFTTGLLQPADAVLDHDHRAVDDEAEVDNNAVTSGGRRHPTTAWTDAEATSIDDDEATNGRCCRPTADVNDNEVKSGGR